MGTTVGQGGNNHHTFSECDILNVKRGENTKMFLTFGYFSFGSLNYETI